MMMMAMAAMAAAAIISFSFLLSLRPSVSVVRWSTLRCAGGAPPPSFLFAVSRSTIEGVEWHANEEGERGCWLPGGRQGDRRARERGEEEREGERIIV